ncbi:MAG: hypothetical protein ACYSR9_15510 [Planctomycetota bacterium]|jgi:epoxyqueuosine reductase QueG
MNGFEKYVRPAQEVLPNFLGKGFRFKLSGRYCNPLKGQLELKEAAERAGLVNWGKSTLVMHPEYSNRLRFMAVVNNALLPTDVGKSTVRKKMLLPGGYT